jgi:predicted amidohydrolase YtcJ
VIGREESRVLIRNGIVRGQRAVDIRVGSHTVLEVGAGLPLSFGEVVLDAAGGAVIPGLHDQHVHLRAVVRARQSLDVSAAAGPADFDRVLAAAAADAEPGQWLRVTGWDEHAAGDLDRRRLDKLAGAVPVRVQHRSGAMWVLNSAALRLVGAGTCDRPGLERDDRGAATGRLLRMDSWLRDQLALAGAGEPADSFEAGLAEYAARCARLGVTGFTDATPDRDRADTEEFARLSAAGLIGQRLVLMAPPGLTGPLTSGRVSLGPVKMMLDDTMLPEVGDLAAAVSLAHRSGSAVAIHCVTADQLVIAVAAFEQAGSAGPDRIEHASVVPPGYPAKLAELGLTVVTQPGFIGARGDHYLRAVSETERRWLYPCASLLRAGVTVAAGTDAPFGPADPWRCIASAVSRSTPDGRVLGRDEQVSAGRALRLFLAVADDPRHSRTVAPGQPGDLCVLRAPLREILARPAASGVRATVMAGQIITA